MPECRYCDASFDDDEAYLEHLQETHPDELGPIDRRRLESDDGDGIGIGVGVGVGPIALGGVIAIAAALVAYLVLFAGGGGGAESVGTTPHAVGSVHYHGTIEMVVDGDRVDFGQRRYVHPGRNQAFHFDRPNDPQWHVHARGVTLAYAMGTLGIEVTESSVTFRGTTYRERDGATVIVEVDGTAVDPAEYVLDRGDRIRIVVRAA